MKRKLPSLFFAVTIVIVARIAVAQAIGTGVVPASASTAVQNEPRNLATADAHELLVKAVHAVDAQRSISAQMRHRISMFGQQLVGTGSYQQQQKQGDQERLLRLDMKINVAGTSTSMQQVCDGRFLWLRRDVGDTKFLGRVDLRRIREATSDGVSPHATADMSSFWMMLGGLPQLLSRIDSHFQFSPAREAALERTPVWVLDGAWKPDVLAALVPSEAENIKAGKPIDLAAIPEQLPTQVRIVLRRSDNFPLQVEYLRQGIAETPDARPPISSLLVMELFDIQLGEAIDPLVFAYKPGDKEVVDHTELYLKNLGVK
jgi:hypothetical protein